MRKISKAKRSYIMSTIRSRNTRPEIIVRRCLYAKGLRYRLHKSDLPGTPDIVFARKRVVVFIHGCFWHRHAGCKHLKTPRVHASYWTAKFARNQDRDRKVLRLLKHLGWKSVVVWECETEKPQALERAVSRVLCALARKI